MIVTAYFPNYCLGASVFPVPGTSSPDCLVFSIQSWWYICCSHFKIVVDIFSLYLFIYFVLRPSRNMGKVKKFEKRKTRQSSSSIFTNECKCSLQCSWNLLKVTSKDYHKNSLMQLTKIGYRKHNK